MMELTDSSDELRDSTTTTTRPETRSPLDIDLNEIPSSSLNETLPPVSDAFAVVRNFHDNLTPPAGAAAGFPGGERSSGCSLCQLPEVRGHMVVCDGCERGFHLNCVVMRGREAPGTLEEWICGECLGNRVRSKRWPLGVSSASSSAAASGSKRSGVRLLDINASPPSDGEGEGSEELQDSRKHIPDDNSFGGNPFGAPVSYSHLYTGNGFGFQNASGIMTHNVKSGFEDILHHTQSMGRSSEEVNFGFPLGRLTSSNEMAIRSPSWNPSEEFLQSLREFISEKHGVLDEDWRVEVKQATNSGRLYPVYCAPDGKTFESMSEVACYLGLISNHNSIDPEGRSDGSGSLQKRLHLAKRKKSTKVSMANGFAENKETLMTGFRMDLSFDVQSMEICASKFGNNIKVTDSGPEETGSQQLNDGLPVQYEDFFILSVGKIDLRPLYHDASQVWPVGYRSCWHDKITGSLFMCYVSDGGDSGPVFKVRRCSCSALPIPIGSTVLFRPNIDHSDGQNEETNNVIYSSMDCDEDGSIEMILSDPCPPMENDIVLCLGTNANEACDVQTSYSRLVEDNSLHERSGNILSCNLGCIDEIGEFSEEGRSSSSVWRMICQKLVDVCCKIYRQTGTIKLFCKHFEDRTSSLFWDSINEQSKVGFTSLSKFCSLPGYVNIAPVIWPDNEVETLSQVLAKWLDQDRFGLDADFVQEIIEQLPGVHACSRYELLNKRSNYCTSLTVGNGLLLAKTESGAQVKEEEALNGLFKGRKRGRTQMVEDPVNNNHCPPVGKPLGSRLSPDFVGDVLQVWEFFGRFYEILGLKEPLSFDELEEELISPWLDDLHNLEKIETENQENQDITSHGCGGINGHTLSTSSESGSAVSKENLHSFIQMETGAMKEAAQARLASITYSRCTGIVLTKAHNSLLKVLVTELQSKVAALVDPNFDAGEVKSRRGKKKDTESSVPAKRTKLTMLPSNELTWPELARRYILGVLTMDGNLDSAETTTRESGKVFRCLQGDGGVLCGSLTGVAGMEADALLLAEATKKIFNSLNRKNDVLTIEDERSDANDASCERTVVNDGNLPEWAQLLEPVRKLPTNVGTRIRKCVYDALEKGPPEWAKKKLEHSISKEVYKGNASGPTKKAVLSVLASACGEGLPQKPEKERKRKSVVSISDIIMKQCCIVLRRAAAADDAKVFCNLLGRKLMNSSDNDDEGLLGSPAMVSRPLDFRTIDLRLSVGAYNGSHEAFLEDVRELWNNVRTAYADQPDFVELAETLSQNFELLYEKEVVTLVQKLVEYAKSECLSAETKKEIDDILVSTNEMPKAPWDEGVCKVCGIDKDDDSVLLCDTCDAEYHTYCLIPPLARIPEGNWYCPSCVSGKQMVQDVSGRIQFMGRRRGKKYQGEDTRLYLEALTSLAAVMEEKEYWEFNVDERTFLLKFLCDELLNSALIRQHLEQCAETSAELQQKWRSISLEWKNLKLKEEILSARAAKVDTGLLDGIGEVGTVEGLATVLSNHGQLHTLGGRPNYFSVFSDDLRQREGGQEGTGHKCFEKHPSVNHSGKNHNRNHQVIKSVGSEDVHAVVDDSLVAGSVFSHMASRNNDQSRRPNDLPSSNPLQQVINDLGREISLQRNVQEHIGKDVSSLPSSDPQVLCPSLEGKNTQVAEAVPPVIVNEPQSSNLELNSVKNDIALLQDSFASVESQLLKQSVRREFLGSDSDGRLYWVSAKPGKRPWVIVDGSVALQRQRKMTDNRNLVNNSSVLRNSVSIGTDSNSTLRGSKASCPFVHRQNGAIQHSSPWISYQSDAEIEELIEWLKDNDPKERELKESILHWRRLRLQDHQQTRNQDQDEPQAALSRSTNSEKASSSNSLVTKAAALLEKKYGPCFDPETSDILRKRGKKSKVTNEGKMYRCECLEPIWPSRHHCLSCHRTFLTDVELDGHNDGRCSSGLPASEKSKENGDLLKGKGLMRSETIREECTGVMDMVEASKSGFSELCSRLIKFQNEGLVCPYDFEEISRKFVTKNSNKELVQEIGLIGSNGIPSFVPSLSPYLSDSTLMLVSHKDTGVPCGDPKAFEKPVFSQVNGTATNAGHDISNNSPRGCAANEITESLKDNRPAVGYLEQRDKNSSLCSLAPEMDVGHCCVVPQSSLRPLVGKISQILRRLKINLLDMDAALPDEAMRPSKGHLEKRWAWRAFVKSAQTIFEMVQATVVFEDMIKTEYLRNGWWYWSSLSAAAKISTMSSLALRIYSLDAAIVYEKISPSDLDPTDNPKPNNKADQKTLPGLDPTEKSKVARKPSKRRKESEG